MAAPAPKPFSRPVIAGPKVFDPLGSQPTGTIAPLVGGTRAIPGVPGTERVPGLIPRNSLEGELARTPEQSAEARRITARLGPSSSAGGTAVRAAGRGVLPSLAGAGGFGAGFAAAGTASAPLNAVPGWGSLANALIALGGGVVGGLGASTATNFVQDKALEALPESITRPIGQDPAQRAADHEMHPYAEFAGNLTPSLLTMRPGFASMPKAPEAASLFTKVMSTQVGSRGVGAALSGATEAGSELAHEGKVDPIKLGMAVVAGAALNKPTALGNALFTSGGNAAIRAMQAGHGAFVNARDAMAGPDFENMKTAKLVAPGLPVPEAPMPPAEAAAPAPAPIQPRGPNGGAVAPVAPLAGAGLKLIPVPGDPFASTPEGAAPAPPEGAPQPALPPPAAAGSDGLGQGAPALPAPAKVEPTPAEPAPAEPAKAESGDPLRPAPGDVGEGERIVRTPAGAQVRTRMEVVDASQLAQAEGANQNRDRSRETTDLQTQDIVSRFDPEQLHEDPSSDRGAPIVGEDGAIDSGNGRVLALNKIYEGYPEQAARYRSMIEGRGFSTEGMERPILIQRRLTEMTPEQRRQFVIDSNKDTKLELSPVERARSDADSITPEMLATYAGGDLNSTANSGFVQAFNSRLTTGEMGGMIGSDRRLTPTGQQRIENAVVAHAYGNPKLLERMMESSSDDIRSITGSLADVAGPWARMRAAAKAGDIDPDLDITKDLADAAARVSDARKRSIKPADILAQSDWVDGMSPVTAELIRGFHNTGMTRAASRKAVSQLLDDYLKEASGQRAAPGLFGEEVKRTPVSILRDLLEARDNPQGAGLALEPKDMANDAEGTPQRNEGRDEVPARRNEEEARDRGKGRGQDVAQDRDGGRDEGVAEDTPDYSEGREATGIAEDRGAYAPEFLTASFTSRTSIFNSAAEELGMDPDKFTLLPAPRQVALLQRAIKSKYGIEVQVDKGMQERFAIDQMLDAYQNVQGMAHVLGLPLQAVNLGGLKILLQKKGNYLGAFQPGANVIMLPKRTNSFAHEWGHALDWHLLSLFDDGAAPGRGITGAIRQRGSDLSNGALPATVREAMVDLLNAMFFDKAGMAGTIMQLEAKIEKTTSPKVKAEAQAQIDRLKDGSSQARNIKSNYWKGAKSVQGGGPEYWTSPTEMFARAFEAYVSYRAEAAGLTTEFIGKGDANYLSNAEERFAKTFPKGDEREAIFAAMENLFLNLADEATLGQGPAAEMPGGTTRRVTDYDKTPAAGKSDGLIKRELEDMAAQRRQKRKAIADRANDDKGTLERLNDMRAASFASMTGQLRLIQARSGSPALQKLIDLLTKQDGKGDRPVLRTFAEDVHIQSNRSTNRVTNILKANKIAIIGRTAAEDMLLRDLLIGEFAGKTNAEITSELIARGSEGDLVASARIPAFIRAAAAIRHVLDEEWHVNQKAGIDLGYTRNGYLQRVLDMPKVYNDQPGFLKAAAKVYEIVFAKEFGEPDDVLADEKLRRRFMALARVLEKKGHDIPSYAEVRKQLMAASKLASAAQAAARAGEMDKADALNAKLEQLMDDLGDLFGQLYDEVQPAFAKERAEAWLTKINLHAGEEHNASSPDSKYTRSRSLPVETDKIMEKFFLSDPVESVTNYLHTSARRTAYARRFGADGKKRVALFERMAREGVSPEDQITVSRIMDTATGRVRSEMVQAGKWFFGSLNALASLALLPRATLSSLGEPFTAALVTGDPSSGFKLMGMMIRDVLKTADGKQRFELARAMGIISDAGSDQIMMARYGQTYGDEVPLDKAVAEMFRATGLTWLTKAQKTAAVGLGHAFLDNLARKVATQGVPGSSDVARKDAIALMNELGIRDPLAFAKEMMRRGAMPTVEELDTPWGEDYSTAQLRFSTMVIQEPNAMDRPYFAANPVGRVIFGITGFSYGYWRNIVKRNGILLSEKWRRGKGMAGLYGLALAAGAGIAYFVNTVISTIRERYLNPNRYKELEKKGELAGTMAALGATRTFSLGAADPVIQAYSGLKYQRDLSNAFIGAGPGFFLQNTQSILQTTTRNSRNTNTAEVNALKGTYSNVSPFIAAAISRIPTGPVGTVAKGVSMAAVTSPVVRDMIAETVAGEKGEKGGTAYDRMLDRTMGKPERRKRTTP